MYLHEEGKRQPLREKKKLLNKKTLISNRKSIALQMRIKSRISRYFMVLFTRKNIAVDKQCKTSSDQVQAVEFRAGIFQHFFGKK